MPSVSNLVQKSAWILFWFAVASPGLFTTYKFYQANEASLEVFFNPVLASQTVFAGTTGCDPTNLDAQFCWEVPLVGLTFMTYPAFTQTTMECVDNDAVVSGVLSKVRAIDYRDLTIYYYLQSRYGDRIEYQFEDVSGKLPKTRPEGVQSWGPWTLNGGCKTDFRQWGAVIQHTRADGRILTTEVGPFPLPLPEIGPAPDAL